MRLSEFDNTKGGDKADSALAAFFKSDPVKEWNAIVNAPKPGPYRKKAIKGIDSILDRWEGRTDKGDLNKRGWLESEGGKFRATFLFGKVPVDVEGHPYAVLTQDEVVPYYKALKAAVEAGDYDDALMSADKTLVLTDKPEKRKRAPDTPEVAAKKRESLAKARAAKAAAAKK